MQSRISMQKNECTASLLLISSTKQQQRGRSCCFCSQTNVILQNFKQEISILKSGVQNFFFNDVCLFTLYQLTVYVQILRINVMLV